MDVSIDDRPIPVQFVATDERLLDVNVVQTASTVGTNLFGDIAERRVRPKSDLIADARRLRGGGRRLGDGRTGRDRRSDEGFERQSRFIACSDDRRGQEDRLSVDRVHFVIFSLGSLICAPVRRLRRREEDLGPLLNFSR